MPLSLPAPFTESTAQWAELARRPERSEALRQAWQDAPPSSEEAAWLLAKANEANQPAQVGLLLELGASPNHPRFVRWQLMAAIQRGCLPVVEAYLKHAARIDWTYQEEGAGYRHVAHTHALVGTSPDSRRIYERVEACLVERALQEQLHGAPSAGGHRRPRL